MLFTHSYRSRPALARHAATIAAVAAGLAVVPAAHAQTATATVCTKVASPTGSDSASGTLSRPYRTAQKLAASVPSGGTGCLRAGTYAADETTMRVSGVRLTSYPGERATVAGRLRVNAAKVTVDGLTLDGRNSRALPSPTINASDVTFRDNDVTNPGLSSCFLLGSTTEVHRVVVQRNRIHDCGNPATVYDHGIYMQNTVGANVLANWIYDNASRGIKVGPDSDFVTIRGNVIDGNSIGLNFSGLGTEVSSDNVVEGNVIANSTGWYNVQSYWPDGLVGTRNVVRRNCVYGGNANAYYNKNGGIGSQTGFAASDNLIAAPGYVNRAAKDFRLSATSPCAGVLAAS